MNWQFHIAIKKVLIALRLLVAVSLVGYSGSFASAAMHGNDISQVSLGSHVHDAGDTQDHAVSNISVDSNDVSDDQDCCKDFCASSAIIAMTDALQDRGFLTARQFLNDQKLTGNILAIDLPPNILS